MNDSSSEQSLRDLVEIVSRLENLVNSRLTFIASTLFVNTGLVAVIYYMAFGPGSLP